MSDRYSRLFSDRVTVAAANDELPVDTFATHEVEFTTDVNSWTVVGRRIAAVHIQVRDHAEETAAEVTVPIEHLPALRDELTEVLTQAARVYLPEVPGE